MPKLLAQLDLDRCPHCNIDQPNLIVNSSFATTAITPPIQRHWKVYVCKRCGGVVTAWSFSETGDAHEVFPRPQGVPSQIPEPAKSYIAQAIDSRHSPAGAVMLAASAIDAMLKAKSYREGSLFSRIDKAAADHLITAEMARWAHNVRLDANEPRHADDESPLPSHDDGQRSISFALALAELLFVLPSTVSRGIEEAEKKPKGVA